MIKNIFTYWTGEKPNLIEQLDSILVRTCLENGYVLHQINDSNLKEYIDIGKNFNELSYLVDKSDYVRVKLLKKYGGLWLDSDVLILRDLNHVFDSIESGDCFFTGFFRRGRIIGFNNAILGSVVNSNFYKEWEQRNELMLESGENTCYKSPFGMTFLNERRDYILKNMFVINALSSGIEILPFRNNPISNRVALSISNRNPPMVHFGGCNYISFGKLNDQEKENSALWGLIKSSLYFK